MRVLPYFRRIQNSEVAIFCVDSYKMQDDTEFNQRRTSTESGLFTILGRDFD